jgi:glutamyl-tRNA synthetase
MKERITFVKDLIEGSTYFYETPQNYDLAIIGKRWKDDSISLLNQFADEIKNNDIRSKEDFETALKLVAEKNECGAGRLIHPIRLAVSGVGVGPGIYDLLVILGKDEVIKRINIAIIEIPKLLSE